MTARRVSLFAALVILVLAVGPVAAGSSPVAPGGDTAFYVYADGGTASEGEQVTVTKQGPNKPSPKTWSQADTCHKDPLYPYTTCWSDSFGGVAYTRWSDGLWHRGWEN